MTLQWVAHHPKTNYEYKTADCGPFRVEACPAQQNYPGRFELRLWICNDPNEPVWEAPWINTGPPGDGIQPPFAAMDEACAAGEAALERICAAMQAALRAGAAE